MADIPIIQARPLFIQGLVSNYVQKAIPTSFLETFFPVTPTVGKYVKYAAKSFKRTVSKDIKRGTQGNVNNAPDYRETTHLPAYHKELINVTELHAYDMAFGTSTGNVDENNLAMLVMEASETMEEVKYTIERAKQKQIADVLALGIVEKDGGESIDYERTASNTTDAASLWTLPAPLKWTIAGNPLATLYSGAEYIRKVGKGTGGQRIPVVFGETAFQLFLEDPQVKERLNFRRADLTELMLPRMNAGGSYHGYISQDHYIFEIWTYSDSYDDENGDDQLYIEPTDVHIIPPSFEGQMVMAGVPYIPEVLKGVAESFVTPFVNALSANAPGYVPCQYVDSDTDGWFAGFKAAPLALLKSRNRIVTLKQVE